MDSSRGKPIVEQSGQAGVGPCDLETAFDASIVRINPDERGNADLLNLAYQAASCGRFPNSEEKEFVCRVLNVAMTGAEFQSLPWDRRVVDGLFSTGCIAITKRGLELVIEAVLNPPPPASEQPAKMPADCFGSDTVAFREFLGRQNNISDSDAEVLAHVHKTQWRGIGLPPKNESWIPIVESLVRRGVLSKVPIQEWGMVGLQIHGEAI